VVEVWREQRAEIILSCLIWTGQQTPFYIFTAFVPAYATKVLGFAQSTTFDFVLVTALVPCFTVPLPLSKR